ncbi:hypothetical protein AAC387_Pa01g3963 [Persea americana]
MLNFLFVFLGLDAGETEIMTNIKEMGELEKRLELFVVDILHYQSIIGALKGCSALFCCLDSLDGYDENMVDLELRGVINVVEACAQTESVEKIVFSSSLLLGSEERMFAWKRMRMRDHGVMQSFAGK